MKKSLEILRDNYISIVSDTDTEMALYYQDHIQVAIKELEELQNRSCSNCTHLRITQFRDYEKATCTNENCDEMFDSDVGNNFCCNKWEK